MYDCATMTYSSHRVLLESEPKSPELCATRAQSRELVLPDLAPLLCLSAYLPRPFCTDNRFILT